MDSKWSFSPDVSFVFGIVAMLLVSCMGIGGGWSEWEDRHGGDTVAEVVAADDNGLRYTARFMTADGVSCESTLNGGKPARVGDQVLVHYSRNLPCSNVTPADEQSSWAETLGPLVLMFVVWAAITVRARWQMVAARR